MSSPTQKPANAWQWIDPRGRESGGWAFILNRITAIGLTVYLFLHLIVLGKLAQGAEAFDEGGVLGEVGREDFEGNVTVHRGLVGLVDGGHPAQSDLFNNTVAA